MNKSLVFNFAFQILKMTNKKKQPLIIIKYFWEVLLFVIKTVFQKYYFIYKFSFYSAPKPERYNVSNVFKTISDKAKIFLFKLNFIYQIFLAIVLYNCFFFFAFYQLRKSCYIDNINV